MPARRFVSLLPRYRRATELGPWGFNQPNGPWFHRTVPQRVVLGRLTDLYLPAENAHSCQPRR